MSIRTRNSTLPNGSALVITLIVVVVLSVIVTSFLFSMSIERLTSQSYADLLRAELATEAAFTEAVHRLTTADLTFPVAAYEEQTIGYKGKPVVAPYLALLKPNATWNGVEERAFLAGTQNAQTAPRTAAKAGEPADFTTDINAIVGDSPFGWIGLRDSTGVRRVVPTEWIYLRDSDNKVIGRYTFWVDDESARIDMMTAGSLESPPAEVTHKRRDGSDATEIAIHGLFQTDTSASDFLNFRNTLGKSWRGLNGFLQTPTGIGWKSEEYQARASMGWGALADERGALGVRKLNLNKWVEAAYRFSTPTERDAIATKVIHLGDFIDKADPTFGTRFYAGTVSESDKRQYCVKLAANIQDYIDPDSQPTVIRHNLGGWQEPPDPTAIGEGAPDSPPAAFGKEVVPSIGEYVGYYYKDSDALRIDHTFEVWNIHGKPIDVSQLGNLNILLAERNDITPYAAGGADPDVPGEPGSPPLTLSFPNVTIPANTYALLTTIPEANPFHTQWVVNSPQRISLPQSEPLYSYGSTGLRMEGDQLATSADVDSEIVLANQFGYLDIAARVAQQGPINLRKTDSAKVVASQSFGNAPTSSGNNSHRGYPLDSGDPRSFTEVFDSYLESGGSPSAVAWRRNTANSQGATRLGGESYNSGGSGPTSGIIPSNSTSRSNAYVPEPVVDLNLAGSSAVDSISVISDKPIKTVGELGFIYDPAIAGSATYGGDVRNRAGFRTLTVGSKLGEKSGPNKLSQVNETNRASRLLELFSARSDRNGILLNSVLRDPPNLALKATLRKLNTQVNDLPELDYPAPRDPNFSKRALSVDADAVITAMTTQVTTSGEVPYLFTGQLADLDIFNIGKELFGSDDNFDISPSTENRELLDRGREEVFRHLCGLLTLKGSVVRVYAIGQTGTINATTNTFVVKGTHRSMRLYEIERNYLENDPLADTEMPKLLENNQPTGVTMRQLAEIKQ